MSDEIDPTTDYMRATAFDMRGHIAKSGVGPIVMGAFVSKNPQQQRIAPSYSVRGRDYRINVAHGENEEVVLTSPDLPDLLIVEPLEDAWKFHTAIPKAIEDLLKAEKSKAEVATSPSFAGFSRMNRHRCESQHGFDHRLGSWSLSDWYTACSGELGEAGNIIKKLNRYRDGVKGNTEPESELRRKLAGELADAFIYLDLLAQAAGIDLGEAVIETFNRKSEQIGYPYVIDIDNGVVSDRRAKE